MVVFNEVIILKILEAQKNLHSITPTQKYLFNDVQKLAVYDKLIRLYHQ